MIVSFFIIIFDFQSPFYIETRSGLFGKTFSIIKLKTMKLSLIDNKKIVTKFGRYLRKTKIDELPQIFNIFIGQMSFVGPRPLYPEYNLRYSKFEKLRLKVKPGITGLAQINVIDNENWRSKFKYDVFYVTHKSFAFDSYILCKTFKLYFELLTGKKHLKESHRRFKE